MRRGKLAGRGSVLALAVVAAGLPATGALAGPGADERPASAQGSYPEDCAQWSYPGDPGFVARSPGELDAAKASWETPEYGNYTGHNPSTPGTAVNYPWQLAAVNASTAYALGYCGQGVTLGMMDSGYRPTHEAFQTELITPVTGEGVYGTSGYGYRGATPANPFTAGEWFTVAGDQARTSDYSHGTGMLGVTSGMRDGIDQHGIAFGSKMYVAKTGGSDSQSHGPFHDYVYWYTANKALVDAGAQVINSSWGSYVQTLDRTRYDGLGNDLGVNGNRANAYQVAGKDSASATAMATIIPNEYLKDLEYQYFFFKKSYSEGGIQYNPNHPGRSFMDAIWDAIKDSGTVNARSAGNNDWSNPYFRPAYPLFNPLAEKQWIAVGGVQPPTATNPEYTKQFGYNEAGLAKWWNVSTPSNNVRTTSSSGDTNYSNSSGTSPATPVATAVMGVLLSRYPDMDARQVRELMFTTANNKMSDGVRFLGTGQTSPSGASIAWTAPDGLPDERWGWGIPDLAKGMYGPGQLLSPMTYNMDKAPLDVWSNDISQIAIKEREREDLEWLAGYKAQGIAYAGEFSPNVLHPDGTLDKQAFMLQGILGDPHIQALTNGHPELYDKITYEDAVKWRKEWMDERAAYIQNNIDNNLYTASLTKQGPGTLIMTGDATYEGGTTVEGGKLSITGSHASSIDVKGGTLGGSGSVGDSVTVTSGVLRPGLASDEAAQLTGTSAGNVLNVGGNVTVGRQGRVAVTISGDRDYTSVRAAGKLVLDGELDLDVRGKLTPGTVFTIMSGSSIKGAFHALPENRALNVGGHLFRVSYKNNSMTLTVMHPVPNNGK
ncbi:autotransporter-associated beta strand repeat-containing protein [Micromonospora viridifaciens]|uniref:Autotransporter-associated beta strand repeat-containing protein n=1 Tax=Micromonospora viridifaciens TaxID=1881 RepID=A0A1C4ZR71_MICVI|nr:S8 family serine peptidase [Micromonospora viridifaciens]SCF35409.1 autotransporter-associated beta strand repeat-containing protein [Micromonospora viridifaciens]